MIGSEAGEVMAVAQTAIIAGLSFSSAAPSYSGGF
jgi:hypothetical protein